MLKPFTLSRSISCNDEDRLSPALVKRQRTTRLIVVVIASAVTARDLDRAQLAVFSGGGTRCQCRRRPKMIAPSSWFMTTTKSPRPSSSSPSRLL
jgi:hypothetical protein